MHGFLNHKTNERIAYCFLIVFLYFRFRLGKGKRTDPELVTPQSKLCTSRQCWASTVETINLFSPIYTNLSFQGEMILKQCKSPYLFLEATEEKKTHSELGLYLKTSKAFLFEDVAHSMLVNRELVLVMLTMLHQSGTQGQIWCSRYLRKTQNNNNTWDVNRENDVSRMHILKQTRGEKVFSREAYGNDGALIY